MRGREANLLGRTSEVAAICCAELHSIAPWAKGVREASPDEDSQGVDLWVDTESWGSIPVQVKSGMKRAREHMAKHPDIPVVVVYPQDSEMSIRRKVRAAVRRGLQIRRHIVFSDRQWAAACRLNESEPQEGQRWSEDESGPLKATLGDMIRRTRR